MIKNTNKLFYSLLILCLLSISCTTRKTVEQSLVLGISTDPINLDPRLASDVSSSQVTGLIFNKLVTTDHNLNIVPDLALRYEMPDEKTYIFHLRRGVLFHNLEELTTYDVKYTFDTILDPAFKSPKKGNYKDLESIEIMNKYAIKFKLKKVNASFLINMAIGIVPQNVANKLGDKFGQNPIGTGPFKLLKYQPDERLEFIAFKQYFAKKPRLKKVTYRIIPDNNVRILELKKGNIDFMQDGFNLDLLPWLKKQDNLKVVSRPGLNYAYIGFNLQDAILRNKKVRQAIALAINCEAIIKHILKDQATLATGILNSDNWAYEPDVKRYTYNPEKAKKLLDEAGYLDPDGEGGGCRFTLIYKTTQDETRKQIGEILQEQLRKVGIEIKIKIYEWGTFYGDIQSGNFQIYTLSWVGVIEPDIYYYVFHSNSIPPHGANRGRYINYEIDKLIENGRNTLDINKRKVIYSRIQKIIAEELPYISLWHTNNIAIMHKKINNFTMHPSGRFSFLKDVHIK